MREMSEDERRRRLEEEERVRLEQEERQHRLEKEDRLRRDVSYTTIQFPTMALMENHWSMGVVLGTAIGLLIATGFTFLFIFLAQ